MRICWFVRTTCPIPDQVLVCFFLVDLSKHSRCSISFEHILVWCDLCSNYDIIVRLTTQCLDLSSSDHYDLNLTFNFFFDRTLIWNALNCWYRWEVSGAREWSDWCFDLVAKVGSKSAGMIIAKALKSKRTRWGGDRTHDFMPSALAALTSADFVHFHFIAKLARRKPFWPKNRPERLTISLQ